MARALDGGGVEAVSCSRRITRRCRRAAPVHAHWQAPGSSRVRCSTRTNDFTSAHGGWPTSAARCAELYRRDKDWVPHISRCLRDVGLLMFTRHIQIFLRRSTFSPCLGGLKRFYGGGDLHFITCSCYRRRALLASEQRRDLFLRGSGACKTDCAFGESGPVRVNDWTVLKMKVRSA